MNKFCNRGKTSNNVVPRYDAVPKSQNMGIIMHEHYHFIGKSTDFICY